MNRTRNNDPRKTVKEIAEIGRLYGRNITKKLKKENNKFMFLWGK